jgi:DNA-binding NtrC family response regulator
MSETLVLLVDDEEDFVTVLAERLERRGLTVETAQNGEEALEKAGGHQFDAVVLDMAMPGMDGVETLRRLLDINKDKKVILLTGQATLKQAVEAMKLGALDLLEKPADIQVLVAKIDDAARKKTKLEDERIERRISDIMHKKGW